MQNDLNTNPLIKKNHIELRSKIRDFAEKEIRPIAAKLDDEARFSQQLTKRMGEIGLLGITIPKEYGGQNLDTLSYIIAVEELARVDSSQAATVAAHNSLGIAPICNYGTKEQKSHYLPKLTTGDSLWAFGLTEADAGSDVTRIKTKAELSDGKWNINGSKLFITNSASDCSAGITVLAISGERNNKKELSVILVDKHTSGYSTEPISNKMLWRAVDTGKISFNNCRVPEKNLLGERGRGAHIMLETLDSGRLSIAAIGLGLAQGAFEMALEYSRKRHQFEQPIGKFQSIAFKLADMQIKLELARNTLYKVCWQKDAKLPFTKEAALIKLYCSEIAKEIADEAVQIHGAYGLMKNNDIERFYRDQRILQIGEGTSEILRVLISRHLGL
ncbi:MAG TPA: acyl-CoA dehydrogenase [Bacteroidales bacterium]|nr:acyl-CoA dehydrogenase [Bacteroidales bacterium]HBQ81765.1 acyl-CoA dehydrogenase [Bacteroidales bacterium]HCU19703.1 acyl-CoA dehydrogenase [Bacteroidales bacterium]